MDEHNMIDLIRDDQFEDTTITAVEAETSGWAITREEGWSFYVPAEYGIEPKVGDTVRFYGRGIGYPVRGLEINGHVLYYRTEAEDRARFEAELAERDAERRRRFEEERPDHDRRIAALPLAFRRRLEKFQRANPEFRWRHEGYELFACEQAVLFADTLGTAEAVAEFSRLEWDEQRRRIPDLSDGHSGNTFGMSCRLASWYLQNPALVILEHGAMTALEGCERFGCPHPVSDDLLVGFEVPVTT